jgi:hypothetical protein
VPFVEIIPIDHLSIINGDKGDKFDARSKKESSR